MKYVVHLFRGLSHSLRGLAQCWRDEMSFRIEVVVAACATLVSFWLASTFLEWGLLVASLLLVLAFELVNSAVEGLVDLASPVRSEAAKKAKDMASAAVAVAIAIACIVWGSAAFRFIS